MDQFYTRDEIAKECHATFEKYVDVNAYDIVLEPSAGKGAFFKLLPVEKRIGLDLDPKWNDIACIDFFDFRPESGKRYAVIGNPPFGKVSSTAVKFFNKAAEFADVIAFILPRTFKRVSIQNKLNHHFHIVSNTDLPLTPCCFEPIMSAKCSFQIWKRQDVPRNPLIYNKAHNDFSFVKWGECDDRGQPTPPTSADFALKAYGGACGEVRKEQLQHLRPKSWHWIKANIDESLLISRFKNIDYSMSKDTVRQDSIGQKEVIFLYEQKYGI